MQEGLVTGALLLSLPAKLLLSLHFHALASTRFT